MSRDLRLRNKCPHRVELEWLALDADLQTLRPMRYPSGSDVRLWWNGREVLRSGLYTQIAVRATLPGPFAISPGQDEVCFRVAEGPLERVRVPNGPAVPAAAVVQAIGRATAAVRAEVSDAGAIVLYPLGGSGDGGPLEFHLEGGSAHAPLGLPMRRAYVAQVLVPTWQVVHDGTRDALARVVRFSEAFATGSDTFEMSYTTKREHCRRCNGLGIENDFRIDNGGEPLFVEDARLLLQEAEKIVFTVKGSHAFHAWYGTSLLQLVGRKILRGGQVLESQLVAEISAALNRYQQIKARQARLQPVSDKEMLRRVASIEVRQDPSDPTVFDVSVVLENRAGQREVFEDTLLVSDFAQNFQRIN